MSDDLAEKAQRLLVDVDLTPGPWSIWKEEDNPLVGVVHDDGAVCDHVCEGLTLADANLIIAAPDLARRVVSLTSENRGLWHQAREQSEARHEVSCTLGRQVSEVTMQVERLRAAIRKALTTANNRWSEWGGRAESVEAILEKALGGEP